MGRVCYEAFRAANLEGPDGLPPHLLPPWPALSAGQRENWRAAADGVLMMADLLAGDRAAQKAAGGQAEAGEIVGFRVGGKSYDPADVTIVRLPP